MFVPNKPLQPCLLSVSMAGAFLSWKPYEILGTKTIIIMTLRRMTQHKRHSLTTLCHYAVRHYDVLHYDELHFAEWNYAKLHYAELHYAELHYAELHYAELHCAELHYAELHYVVRQYVASH